MEFREIMEIVKHLYYYDGIENVKIILEDGHFEIKIYGEVMG